MLPTREYNDGVPPPTPPHVGAVLPINVLGLTKNEVDWVTEFVQYFMLLNNPAPYAAANALELMPSGVIGGP